MKHLNPPKEPIKEPQITKITMGIDLGNTLTTIYFNSQLHIFYTELTINLNSKKIIIGQQPTSLQQKLQAKHNSLKQSTYKEGQLINRRQSSIQKRFIDLLDLYVKGFTQRNLSMLEKQKDLFESTLPKCFRYNGHEFEEDETEGIQIVLERGFRIKEDQAIILTNQKKTSEDDRQSLVDKIQEQTIRLDQCIRLLIETTLSKILQKINLVSQNSKSQQIPQIQLVFNYRGFEGNPYLYSLSNIKSLAFLQNNSKTQLKSTVNFIYTTTSLAISFYLDYLKLLKTSLNKSTFIACLDFGSRGCSFSIYKLYPSQQNVIQSQQHFSQEFGGIDITRILVDMIIDHVKLHKGVNIGSTAQMTQELYKLAEQTKIALTEAEEVYVRIQGYPLQQPYGFYLKRFNLQRMIQTKCKYLVDQINKLCKKYPEKIRYFLVAGQTINTPLFRQYMNDKVLKHLNAQIINTNRNWLAKGNYLWKESGVIILQKSQSQISIKGDQEYFETLLEKGQTMPVRLVKEIPFPRGELAYNLKFYQNSKEIGKYIIESKNLEWNENLNFVAEKEENRALFVYSTKYLGDIELRGSKLCNQVRVNKNVNFQIHFMK